MLDIIFDVRQPGEKRKDVTSSYQCHSGAGLRTKAIVASRSDANSVDTRTYRSSWRLTFRFDGDQVELASAERVARVAPGGTEASGSWVDLVDRRGRVLFRRVLHDPFRTTAEHHSPDGQIEVVRRSDGVENTAPMLSTVTSSITANTFAIGLGLPYNISTAALNMLTQGTGGYLLITGALTPDQRTRLSKYFLQVLAGITNANVVEDPHGDLALGVEHRIPFAITEADYGFDAFILTDYPQLLDFQLEAPDGSRIDPASFGPLGTTEFVVRAGVAFYRVALPAIPVSPTGSHRGTWHIVLGIGKRSPWSRKTYASAAPVRRAAASAARGVLPYDALVHCYSNLTFRAYVSQSSYEPGAVVRMVGDPREYDVPVTDRASVWAEITGPSGTASVVSLTPDGSGLHAGQVTTGLPGVYRIRIRARGETLDGTPFTREQTCTAVAVPGGDRPPQVSTPGAIDLLCCLLADREGGGELAGRLEGLGIDARELQRCLSDLCQPNPADIERGLRPR
jgi:hypothetical protein